MTEAVPAVRSAALRLTILAGLVLLGWVTLRNAAVELWAERDPDRAMMFAPAAAAVLANAAQARIVAAGGTVDPTARAQTAQALRRAPRDAAPLVLAGLAASADGAEVRARALMEAARARDPRAAIARYWLLDHYVRTGRDAQALAEIGPALRLRPGTREAIFALVSAMAARPDTQGAVRSALAAEPDWRESFFATQATANIEPVSLLRLLASLPPPADPAAAARERRAVLLAAARAGAYREARAFWRTTLPPAARDAGVVADPAFAHGFGDVPFGWSVPAAPGLEAQAGNGLHIAYRGDAPATVTEQLVVGEGRYRLSLRGRGGNVVARLACARDESPLATVPAGGAVDAAIPAGCGAAWLRIVVAPAEGGQAMATLTDVRMTRP